MNKLIIVIPVFNEETSLQMQLFEDFIDKNGQYEFIFVNDASTDNSKYILEKFCKKFSQKTFLINLSKNSGKAEAVRQGFLKAFEKQPEYIGFLDADLSAPLDVVCELKKNLDNTSYFMVMASRVLMMGRFIKRKIWRHYIGRFYATLFSLTLNLPVYDTQCGAKLFRNNQQLKDVMAEKFLSRWLFDVEIIARISLLNKDKIFNDDQKIICEYPLRKWVDVGSSKVKITDGLLALWEIVIIFYNYKIREKEWRKN